MKLLITLAVLALPVLALPALAADYRLDLKPENTKVQFTLTDPLHTVHGGFQLKRGQIDFNSDTGRASGQVVVDVASGNSGSDARDSRMHANVLESKKYPEAVFSPDRVDGPLAVPGSSTAKVHGTFTIHGAAHEVTMDVHTSGTEDQFHATMTFEIPYVAWGMKDPSNFLLRVGKTVQMTIETSGPLQKH
jgi:polyisoprenoid-binding protein YceI